MSSHHSGVVWNIDHQDAMSSNISSLLQASDIASDVTLSVSRHKFYAHKQILSARSDFFRYLLNLKKSLKIEFNKKNTVLSIIRNKLSEMSKSNVSAVLFLKFANMSHVERETFAKYLAYVYTGEMSFPGGANDLPVILEMLGIAQSTQAWSLSASLVHMLRAMFNTANVCRIYEAARAYGEHTLADMCADYIDAHALLMLHEKRLTSDVESADNLAELIKRDTFNVGDERIVYELVRDWHEWHNASEAPHEELMRCVRFQLMSLEELNSIRVESMNDVCHTIIADAIFEKIANKTTARPRTPLKTTTTTTTTPKTVTSTTKVPTRPPLLSTMRHPPPLPLPPTPPLLASGSTLNNSVLIYETIKGNCIRVLLGHTGLVRVVDQLSNGLLVIYILHLTFHV